MEDRSDLETLDPPIASDSPSPQEKTDAWRAACWAYYLNGGGGDPSYFGGELYNRRER